MYDVWVDVFDWEVGGEVGGGWGEADGGGEGVFEGVGGVFGRDLSDDGV